MPDPIPYTITGLALHLGTNRQTLINYENRDEFFDAINTAKLRCEHFAERSLWQPKIATGVIFNLKNNYGWRDQREVSGPDGEAITIAISEHVAQKHKKK